MREKHEDNLKEALECLKQASTQPETMVELSSVQAQIGIGYALVDIAQALGEINSTLGRLSEDVKEINRFGLGPV